MESRRILDMIIIMAVIVGVVAGVPLPVPGADHPPIRLEVTPKVQMAHPRKGGEVYVKVTLPVEARIRRLCVVLDGTTWRSSCFDHVAGIDSQRREWAIKGLEPGCYVARVVAEGEEGGRSTATDQFVISGGEAACG